jgi:hypothetical protein
VVAVPGQLRRGQVELGQVKFGHEGHPATIKRSGLVPATWLPRDVPVTGEAAPAAGA